MRRPLRMLGYGGLAAALLITGSQSMQADFGMSKTRLTLPRFRPPSSPILVERVSLDVASDSADVSASHADYVRTRLAESLAAWKLYRVVDTRERPEAVVRVSLRGMDTVIRTEIEMENKYVKIGEKQEWDAKKKKTVTKDVMGYRNEPVTIHVIEGRVQGTAQVEAGGVVHREDVGYKYAGREKYKTNFPEEVRTVSGLRDYLVARLADKAVGVATFGPDPVEALLATDGDLKPGNRFAEAGLFREAMDEWSRRTFKGDKEAARLHNIGVGTEALAYGLPPFAPEHVAQLQQAKELYKRAFMMDPKEKYFVDPLKRIDVSIELAQRGAAVKADLDRARKAKGGPR